MSGTHREGTTSEATGPSTGADPAKVVIALTGDPESALHAIREIISTAPGSLVVEIVCDQQGLDAALRCSAVSLDIRALMDDGHLTAKACQDCLEARSLSAQDLLMGAEVVRSPRQHLNARRGNGWTPIDL